jgi:DNA helicase-2/ATP-dependent DNA helicase PcrA
VCAGPLTVGVLHRVDELADRAGDDAPAGRPPFRSFVPLPEIIAETVAAGPASRAVTRVWERLIGRVGPELFVLEHAPVEDLRRHGSELVAEGIRRMRAGEVIREAGYDGEYGTVRMFRPHELARSGLLFTLDESPRAPVEDASPADGADASALAGDATSAQAAAVTAVAAGAPSDLASRSPDLPAPAGPGMLAGLDPEQAEAAGIVRGPLLIVAGPGTGKTRTLTRRIAHLVRDRGVDPASCLAITFTRRAAAEMQERLVDLLGAEGERVVVRTFHGFGRDLLRAHAAALGLTAAFRVAHAWEQLAVVQEALQVEAAEARRLLADLSHAARTCAAPPPGSALEQASRAYRRGLRARDLVDCDELVALAVELLAGDPDLRAAVVARFAHVSVDEYQDVDELQYRLVRLLAPADGELCAIGDPDQAIYGFRGADVGYFLRFRADYPGTREVQLVRNYRSGRRIVDASMQVIEKRSLAAGRVLRAQRSDALAVVILEAASAAAEAEFVVHTIERQVGGSSFFSVDSGRVDAGDASAHGFGDFAVLYRSSGLLGPLEEALLRSGIPFERRSHSRLDAVPEVRALVEALPSAAGATPAERLAALAGRSPALDRAAALLRPLARRCETLAELVDEIAAGAQCDAWDPRADRVSLLTLHAAKGLEFPVVFIVGCEDGISPLRMGPDVDVDEERRLFFVGMTRAQQRLYLTHARRRTWRGALREQSVSPFVLDIREELLEHARSDRKRPDKPVDPQLALF